jgi:hypothetical protein
MVLWNFRLRFEPSGLLPLLKKSIPSKHIHQRNWFTWCGTGFNKVKTSKSWIQLYHKMGLWFFWNHGDYECWEPPWYNHPRGDLLLFSENSPTRVYSLWFVGSLKWQVDWVPSSFLPYWELGCNFLQTNWEFRACCCCFCCPCIVGTSYLKTNGYEPDVIR